MNSKYRLKPDEKGTYYLQRYHIDVEMWLTEVARVTPEQADKCIANLEREVMYYRDEPKEKDVTPKTGRIGLNPANYSDDFEA